MFVGGRSALFLAFKEAADPCSLWPTKGAGLLREGRLRAILRRIASAWTGESGIPLWKDDQIRNPEQWEVRIPFEPDSKPKWMSKKSFDQFGFICVDVKSHQTNSSHPYPVIIEGNDAQDTYCNCTNVRHRPADILLPSCCPFAFYAKMGEWLQLSPTSLLVISFAANRLHAWRLSSLKENLLILKAGSIHTRLIFVRLRHVRSPLISSTFCSQKIERTRLI